MSDPHSREPNTKLWLYTEQQVKELNNALRRLDLPRQKPVAVIPGQPNSCCKVAGDRSQRRVEATRDLKPGECIIQEPLLFCIAYSEDGPSKQQLQRECRRLKDDETADFDDLAVADPSKASRVEKFQTNCFKVDGNNCIFLNAARINHSCVPNAYWTFNHHLNMITVYATEHVGSGMEITISYQLADVFRPHAERQRKLQDKYHFTCKCRTCLNPTGSDSAIGELRTIYEKYKVARWATPAPDNIDWPIIRAHPYRRATTIEVSHDYWHTISDNLRLLHHLGIAYPYACKFWDEKSAWYQVRARIKLPAYEATPDHANLGLANSQDCARKAFDLTLIATGPDSAETRNALTRILNI